MLSCSTAFADALHFPAINVGDDELRARLMELLAQVRADVPEALDGDHLALERIGSPSMVGRRLDRTEHATRRHRRRVARPVREAADVLRFHVHEIHVGRARAHVFRRDVATAERIHEPAMGAEDHLALDRAVVANDHGLATPEVQAGDRVLVRHAARQSQGVDDRLFVGGVMPETRATERGA
jgi:hypothetical protein